MGSGWYATLWLLLLVALFIVTGVDRLRPPSTAILYPALAILSVRFAHLFLFHMRLLLERAALRFEDPRRALALEVVNLAELVVMLATVAVLQSPRPRPAALAAAFDVVTLRTQLTDTNILRVADGLAVLGTLLVLSGAVGVILGALSSEIKKNREES